MSNRLAMAVVGAGALVLGACVPDVGESDTTVREPRILAVRAQPAEAAPRQSIAMSALYASADGTLAEAPLDWAFCHERKALDELGPISRACLVEKDGGGEALAPLGDGASVDAALPGDACRLFGPDRPPPKDDEPAGRPVDPDPTGGFYQPVRLFDAEQGSFTTFDARIACGLQGVTQQQFAEFNRRYRKNANPALAALERVDGKRAEEIAVDGEGDAPEVKAGAELVLRASWDRCTRGNECGDGVCGDGESVMDCADDCAELRGCGGAEHYLYYDRDRGEFVMRRETMRVSWFASAGTFDDAHTGRTEAESAANETTSQNTWTAPAKKGEVVLWVVLRDDRGGVAWQSYRVRVR
jgi:hypothetical protein